jgi:hypothetical protein
MCCVDTSKDGFETMKEPTLVTLIVLFVILFYAATRLELFNFSGNVGLTLGVGKSLSFMFDAL